MLTAILGRAGSGDLEAVTTDTSLSLRPHQSITARCGLAAAPAQEVGSCCSEALEANLASSSAPPEEALGECSSRPCSEAPAGSDRDRAARVDVLWGADRLWGTDEDARLPAVMLGASRAKAAPGRKAGAKGLLAGVWGAVAACFGGPMSR